MCLRARVCACMRARCVCAAGVCVFPPCRLINVCISFQLSKCVCGGGGGWVDGWCAVCGWVLYVGVWLVGVCMPGVCVCAWGMCVCVRLGYVYVNVPRTSPGTSSGTSLGHPVKTSPGCSWDIKLVGPFRLQTDLLRT